MTFFLFPEENEVSDLEGLTADLMADPRFREEYERIRQEWELPESVLAARQKAGLTREELARRANVSLSAVKGLEDRAKIPGLARLRRIAEALGLNLRITLQERAA